MIRTACVITSTVFSLLALYALLRNRDYASSNHSFLFGTPAQQIVRMPLLVAIVAAAPLVLPLALRRDGVSVALAISAAAVFLFVRWVCVILSD